MAQKSYKKKIHNKVTVYQTNKLPTGMKVSRIMKVIEKKIPKHFLSEVDALIIADLEKIGSSEGMVEGDTIFIDSQQYCEDLLIENFPDFSIINALPLPSIFISSNSHPNAVFIGGLSLAATTISSL